MSLPQLVQDGGRVWATSLDVAEKFGKQHGVVLRAIRELDCSAEFNRCNFAEINYTDGRGRVQPMIRMTRDGFAFLAFGFTGKEAAEWKEKYIAAFNAMEQSIRQAIEFDGKWLQEILERQTTLSEQLAGNVLLLDGSVKEVTHEVRQVSRKIDDIEGRVITLEQRRPRKDVRDSVKAQHRLVMQRRNWSCPCCLTQTRDVQFDHFFSNQQPDFEHTWPLCVSCHLDLTRGVRSRPEVRSRFDAYQEFALDVLPAQKRLL